MEPVFRLPSTWSKSKKSLKFFACFADIIQYCMYWRHPRIKPGSMWGLGDIHKLMIPQDLRLAYHLKTLIIQN